MNELYKLLSDEARKSLEESLKQAYAELARQIDLTIIKAYRLEHEQRILKSREIRIARKIADEKLRNALDMHFQLPKQIYKKNGK